MDPEEEDKPVGKEEEEHIQDRLMLFEKPVGKGLVDHLYDASLHPNSASGGAINVHRLSLLESLKMGF